MSWGLSSYSREIIKPWLYAPLGTSTSRHRPGKCQSFPPFILELPPTHPPEKCPAPLLWGQLPFQAKPKSPLKKATIPCGTFKYQEMLNVLLRTFLNHGILIQEETVALPSVISKIDKGPIHQQWLFWHSVMSLKISIQHPLPELRVLFIPRVPLRGLH